MELILFGIIFLLSIIIISLSLEVRRTKEKLFILENDLKNIVDRVTELESKNSFK